MSNFVQSSILNMPGFEKKASSSSKKRKVSGGKHIETIVDDVLVDALNEKYKEKDELAGKAEASRRQKARRDWNESWVRTFAWANFNLEVCRIFCDFCKRDPKCKNKVW